MPASTRPTTTRHYYEFGGPHHIATVDTLGRSAGLYAYCTCAELDVPVDTKTEGRHTITTHFEQARERAAHRQPYLF